MLFTSLDTIVRRTLLEKGLPLHYYIEYLFHAATCVRNLSIDTLKIVNTTKCVVNSYSAIDLPDDFVDDVSLGFNVSGFLKNIPHTEKLNPIRNRDENGNFVGYNTSVVSNSINFYGFMPGWSAWFWNVNDFGEPTGRYFGVGGGSSVGYTVIKERRQIQLTSNVGEGEAILMYISDGMSADSATQIDTMAWDAINAYINWKSTPNANNERSPEANTFYNQKRILRARLNPITVLDIKNVLRKNYIATIKT